MLRSSTHLSRLICLILFAAALLLMPHSARAATPAETPYIGLQLRSVPVNTVRVVTYDATLLITNQTTAPIPAGTLVTFTFRRLSFAGKNQTANTISGGATWKSLTVSKGVATLDSALAPAASLTLSVHLTLLRSITPDMIINVRATLLGYGSNSVHTTGRDNSQQGLDEHSTRTKATAKGNFFAFNEPLSVSLQDANTSNVVATQSLVADKMGRVTTAFSNLQAGVYVIYVTGQWSGVVARTREFNIHG